MEHNDVDIACITETWLSDEIHDSQVSLKDFTLFRKDRPTHAGGIAAFIRSCIPCIRLWLAEWCKIQDVFIYSNLIKICSYSSF